MFVMNSISGEVSVFRLKSHAGFHCAYEPVPIKAEVQRFVEDARLQPRFAGPETAWLNDVVREPQISLVVFAAHVAAIGALLIVNEMQTVAKQEFRLSCVKLLGDESQRARQIEIVRVEPAENASRRQRETLVQRVGLTAILFTFPMSKVALVFFYDLDTIVRTPTVHDDVFQIRILLADHRQDRLLQETALVIRRRDDGDLLEA